MNERGVARAIVGYEVGGLVSASPPTQSDGSRFSSFTCQEIVDKYDLNWGHFGRGEGFSEGYVDEYFYKPYPLKAPRAPQVIRNELNRLFKLGTLNKIQDRKGNVVRREGNVVYVDGWAQALRLGPWLRVLRYGQKPSPLAGAQLVTNWPAFMEA